MQFRHLARFHKTMLRAEVLRDAVSSVFFYVYYKYISIPCFNHGNGKSPQNIYCIKVYSENHQPQWGIFQPFLMIAMATWVPEKISGLQTDPALFKLMRGELACGVLQGDSHPEISEPPLSGNKW